MRRDPRRRLVQGGLAGAVALLAALGTTGVSQGPALAAAPALRVHLVAGDGMLTAAWSRVTGASRYTVRYSTSRSMAHAASRSTAALSMRLPRLQNNRSYWVAVRPVLRADQAASVTPGVPAQAEPKRGVPLPVATVTARPGGTDQVVVTWTGGDRAQKVAVIAGSDSMTDTAHFTSAWYPSTTRSITLTVPAAFRSVIGGGTGNVVFVKVVQSNSASTAHHLTFDQPDAYRLSPPGTWSLAGDDAAPVDQVPGAPSVATLRIGTLNVQSESASAQFSAAHHWVDRMPKVARTIEASQPDLLGTEELDTTRSVPGCLVHMVAGVPQYCTEQYDTLAARLADGPVPYRLANSTANAFIRNEEQAHTGTAVIDSHLFYNPAKLSVVESGYFSPKYDLGVPWDRSVIGDDRGGSWAEFQILATGQRFVAAAVHLTVGSGTAIATNRQQEAAALASYLDAKAATPEGALPIVLVGDFNSYAPSDTQAPSTVLVQRGYFDAAATTNRSGWRFGTSNAGNGPDGVDPGYPVHAVLHPYPTSRIDYLLLKNSPHSYRYENVTHISGGVFQDEFQGTDHNLQIADVGIGGPVAGG